MSIRVVVADDVEVMRAMIRLALESHGFEIVAEAEDGAEAIEAYRTHRPDVLILDLQMREVHGLEVAREILSQDPEARFIVCTSLGQDETIRQALELGAKDFVIKPIDPQRLIQAVESAVNC